MIQVNYNINMPKACKDCPLQDEEFHYCHGRLCSAAWECDDYRETQPKWCPLIEEETSCTKCMLGAPYTICWVTQCSNYKVKKKEEERWETLIKQLEKKYEGKGNN